MKLKKIFLFLILIFTISLIGRMNIIQAANTTTCKYCRSTAQITSTKAATCTTAGTRTISCSKCGNTYTETTQAALGHGVETYQVVKAPTCTTAGREEAVCYRCGQKFIQTIPATGHNYVSIGWKDATCTKPGQIVYKCKNCNDIKYENSGNAKGHDWSDGTITSQPTCTKTGIKIYTCTRCGVTKQETLSALGHSWAWRTTKVATCTEQGTQEKYCTVCGATGGTTTIPVTEHSYTTTVTEPTCKEKGFTTHTCSVCGNSYKDNYKDIVDHSYKFIREQELTCVYNHFKYYECKWCGKGKYENIELTTGHKWEGTTCSVCGATMDKVIEIPWDISADDGTSNVTAQLYKGLFNGEEKYTLYISGTGAMKDFSETDQVPWKDYKEKIEYVYIENGVTNISDFVFASLIKVEQISIPESVTTIGNSAFLNCKELTSIYIPDTVESIGTASFYRM